MKLKRTIPSSFRVRPATLARITILFELYEMTVTEIVRSSLDAGLAGLEPENLAKDIRNRRDPSDRAPLVSVHVRLPQYLIAAVEQLADQAHNSQSNVYRTALARGLDLLEDQLRDLRPLALKKD